MLEGAPKAWHFPPLRARVTGAAGLAVRTRQHGQWLLNTALKNWRRALLPARVSGAAVLLLGATLGGCVLPANFGTELEADLDRQQIEARREAEQQTPPPVLHSDGPFIDATPRPVPPAWTGKQIGIFRAAPATAVDLLRLAATAVGVRALFELTALPGAGRFHFGGGTAAELMTALADQLGLFWRAAEQTVTFSDRRVQVFDLATFADLQPPEQAAQGLGSVAAAPVAAATTQEPEFHLRIWRELEERVSLLAGEGAEVALSPEQGVLTLRARPAGLAAAAEYLENWNRAQGRQVELDVKLVQVAFTDERGIGLDWSAVRDRMNRDFSISASSGLTSRGDALVVSSETRGDEVVSALFNAFASQGRVRVLTNPRAVALNGRATDIALVTQTAYLARTLPGAASAIGGSSEAGLEPGVVESGFVLRILPKIRDRQILLRLNARISTLRDIAEVSSGNQSIQVPTLTESRFSHWVRVMSGDTLVLGGVRELHSRQDARSAPYRSSQREHSEQVLLITPRLL